MTENYEKEAKFVDSDSKFISAKRSNVQSELIEITEDKLENILLKHLNKLKFIRSWITPLSLLITVIIAKSTATFSDFLNIKAAVWEALFLLGGICFFVWFIFSAITAYRNRQSVSVEYLINTIKNAESDSG